MEKRIVNEIQCEHKSQGLRKKAEELEVQVMETMKRVLGAEYPSTLTSMNNRAYTWKS